jgi:hypothetical protein
MRIAASLAGVFRAAVDRYSLVTDYAGSLGSGRCALAMDGYL